MPSSLRVSICRFKKKKKATVEEVQASSFVKVTTAPSKFTGLKHQREILPFETRFVQLARHIWASSALLPPCCNLHKDWSVPLTGKPSSGFDAGAPSWWKHPALGTWNPATGAPRPQRQPRKHQRSRSVPALKPGRAESASDGGSLNTQRETTRRVFISLLLTYSGLDLIKHKQHTDRVSLFHFLHVCAIVSTSDGRSSVLGFFFVFVFQPFSGFRLDGTAFSCAMNCCQTCLKTESER